MADIDAFLAARDFLMRHREDYAQAYDAFRWPALTHFNWALDYFDRIEGAERTALRIVDESGADTRLSFADLSRRSNRVANHLRSLGVKRGERILLMLGNVVPLWECMLAAMKLGAVVIPSTTLLGRNDLADRIARGRVGTVIAPAGEAGKFADLAEGLRRIVVAGGSGVPAGWHPYEKAAGASETFAPDGPTAADDPMLLYFT